VTDHPLKRGKIVGVWEYRSKKGIPKFRSRREETIMETVDSCITSNNTVSVRIIVLTSVMRPSKRRWHTFSQLNRAMAEIVTIEK